MADGHSTEGFRRPNPGVLALEAPRALGELGLYAMSAGFLRAIPPGDGHPVLVFPGFTASDTSTRMLRHSLRRWGYYTHGWRLGRNLGPTDYVLDGIEARMAALAEQHQQTITLIGWSLGGIYAREVARQVPELVRGVITLGSPFRLTMADESNASTLYNRLTTVHGTRPEVADRLPEHDREPLVVPCTNIYSRTDGVVDWRSCLDDPGPRRENIEVFGSHCGLGHNPAVLAIVANRLAQRDGEWKPFRWSMLRPRLRRSVAA